MRKLRLVIEYCGTQYSGWQQQPEHPTIQETLLETLRQILSGDVRGLVGSGRTDARVHALGQVATFITDHEMDTETLCRALNATLPPDISVWSVEPVADDFHVIADAIGKLYRYRIHNSNVRSALRYDRVWQIHNPLDLDAMRAGAQHLEGEHDFASFMTAGTPVQTTVRNLSSLSVDRAPGDPTEIWVEAYSNGFLRGMVRNIVGALVDIGLGKLEADRLPALLATKDRREAPRAAPAWGLYLVRVDYP